MKQALIAATVLTLLSAASAEAAPLLGDDVTDPVIEAGMTAGLVQMGRLNGGPADGEVVVEAALERALSNRWLVGAGLEVSAEPGASTRMEAFNLEAQVYLGRVPGLGVDVGLVGEYVQPIHGEAGAAEVSLLLGRDIGPVRGRFNLVAEQPLTGRDDEGAMAFAYSAQAALPLREGLEIGLQAYGDLGDNRDFGTHSGHYVGPMIAWEAELPGETAFSLEAAYLAAVGDARNESDGELRLLLEVERRF